MFNIAFKNTYNTTSTTISIEQAILANSGSIYYAALAGSTTSVFSKEDPTGNFTWIKSYDPHFFFHKGFVVTSDESKIFSIDTSSLSNIKILKVSGSDGSLQMRYE